MILIKIIVKLMSCLYLTTLDPFEDHFELKRVAVMPESNSDCASCKVIGARGCFAGAVYAFYQRAQLPTSKKHRQWLALVGTGEFEI